MKLVAKGAFQSYLWVDGDRLYHIQQANEFASNNPFHFDIIERTGRPPEYMPGSIQILARAYGLDLMEAWELVAAKVMSVDNIDRVLEDPIPYFMRALL